MILQYGVLYYYGEYIILDLNHNCISYIESVLSNKIYLVKITFENYN